MEELHVSAPVQHLGGVSGVKHRPSKPPLQAGYGEHGKTEFLFVSGGEKTPDTIVFAKARPFFLFSNAGIKVFFSPTFNVSQSVEYN